MEIILFSFENRSTAEVVRRAVVKKVGSTPPAKTGVCVAPDRYRGMYWLIVKVDFDRDESLAWAKKAEAAAEALLPDRMAYYADGRGQISGVIAKGENGQANPGGSGGAGR